MYAHQFILKLPISDQVELSDGIVGTLAATVNEVYRVLKNQAGFVEHKMI